ncbi:FixH family protein [Alteraurantiacibacter palmitatis]|uniref:FixH family protein n=1 Tax=Alteraurantiacibacter palmitatis TaxID=2054628 RepID=A0ABV7E3U2_9SPHN
MTDMRAAIPPARRFTGWHMLAVMGAFFGVIIAVNFTMARIAIGSFGGVVVENSYVASQDFNDWLEQARAQEELGWQVDKSLSADRRVLLRITGAPATLSITGSARPPLGGQAGEQLSFTRIAPGEYVSTSALAEGRWVVRLQIMGDGHIWRSEEELR